MPGGTPVSLSCCCFSCLQAFALVLPSVGNIVSWDPCGADSPPQSLPGPPKPQESCVHNDITLFSFPPRTPTAWLVCVSIVRRQIFCPSSLKGGSLCTGSFLPRMCNRVWKSEAQTLVEREKDRRKEGEGKEKRGQVLVIPYRCNNFSLVWCPQHIVFTMRAKSLQSHPTLTPWTVACQAPLSMIFPRQENWSGLPFPSPGDLHHVFGLFPPSPNWSSWLWISLSLQHRALNN